MPSSRQNPCGRCCPRHRIIQTIPTPAPERWNATLWRLRIPNDAYQRQHGQPGIVVDESHGPTLRTTVSVVSDGLQQPLLRQGIAAQLERPQWGRGTHEDYLPFDGVSAGERPFAARHVGCVGLSQSLGSGAGHERNRTEGICRAAALASVQIVQGRDVVSPTSTCPQKKPDCTFAPSERRLTQPSRSSTCR